VRPPRRITPAPPQPVEDQIRSKLEEEKQKQVLDEIVKNNPIEIPEDFQVPEPSAEQLQEMQQMQQMQMEQMQKMQQGGEDDEPPPAKPKAGADKKPADKKADDKK
jgi:hypothetical protein